MSMVQYCLTSTETMRLVGTDSLGRLHRLSNFGTMIYIYSSWLKCCFTSTETVGLLGTGYHIYIKIQNLAGVAVIYIYDELMLNVLRCQLTY